MELDMDIAYLTLCLAEKIGREDLKKDIEKVIKNWNLIEYDIKCHEQRKNDK